MRKSGFSLIELVIAVSLASLVLVAVASLAMQMTRSQVEGIRSGTMTGWSVVSYITMAKEIEDANVLAYPIVDGTAQDAIMICKNWSRNAGATPGVGAKLDANGVVSVIQYCLDTTAPVAPLTGFVMRRYARASAAEVCPAAAAPVACNAAGPGWIENGAASNAVVGFRVERLTGQAIFLRSNAIGGVRVRYVIGNQAGTPQQPIPKFTTFDYGISMQKQLSSTVD
jgi:prepilin-type N-terminal cleavage/methylation domain-containing protein